MKICPYEVYFVRVCKRYFVRVNRVFQGIFLGILIYIIQNLSPPRVFKIFTRGFRRYKGADIAKKTLGADF